MTFEKVIADSVDQAAGDGIECYSKIALVEFASLSVRFIVDVLAAASETGRIAVLCETLDVVFRMGTKIDAPSTSNRQIINGRQKRDGRKYLAFGPSFP